MYPGVAMPDYRGFRLLKTGRINAPSVTVTCDTDDEVVEKVRQMLETEDLEVWDGPAASPT